MPPIADGVLSIPGNAGAWVRYNAAGYRYGSLEFLAEFGQGPWQHIGFGSNAFEGNRYLLFSTNASSTNLFARANNNANETSLNLGPIPVGMNHYRIEWSQLNATTDQVRYLINGALAATLTAPAVGPNPYVLYLANNGPASLRVAEVAAAPAYSTSGVFTSCIFDGATVQSWSGIQWSGTAPAGSTQQLEVRTSDDLVNWSAWNPVPDTGSTFAPTVRYLQFRITQTGDGQVAPFFDWMRLVNGQPVPTSTPSPVPTATATPVPTAENDLILAGTFDAGNLNEWMHQLTDNGDLEASSAAALVGSAGMRAIVDDNQTLYVGHTIATNEPVYRQRFYFDPNSISMASGNQHMIATAYEQSAVAIVYVELRFSGGSYQVRAAQRSDGTLWWNTAWFSISDSAHYFELHTRKSSAARANNGMFEFWIDGVQVARLINLDTDTRSVRATVIGPVSGMDAGTRGVYYFDQFEARRVTYIGAAAGALMAGSDADEKLEAFGEGEIIEVYVPDKDEVIDHDQYAAMPENALFLPVVGK